MKSCTSLMCVKRNKEKKVPCFLVLGPCSPEVYFEEKDVKSRNGKPLIESQPRSYLQHKSFYRVTQGS